MAQRVRAHWRSLSVAWHKDEESDVMVPGAFYSELESRRMLGGRRKR